jgi:uncharacterized protein with HEPN domain
MTVLNDQTRLSHIKDACQQIQVFLEGKTKENFEADNQLQLAITRLVEIVGEASSKITKEFQAQHPEIPWVLIISMRNRLVHAYFEIDFDVLWDTATVSIPVLLKQIETLLEE